MRNIIFLLVFCLNFGYSIATENSDTVSYSFGGGLTYGYSLFSSGLAPNTYNHINNSSDNSLTAKEFGLYIDYLHPLRDIFSFLNNPKLKASISYSNFSAQKETFDFIGYAYNGELEDIEMWNKTNLVMYDLGLSLGGEFELFYPNLSMLFDFGYKLNLSTDYLVKSEIQNQNFIPDIPNEVSFGDKFHNFAIAELGVAYKLPFSNNIDLRFVLKASTNISNILNFEDIEGSVSGVSFSIELALNKIDTNRGVIGSGGGGGVIPYKIKLPHLKYKMLGTLEDSILHLQSYHQNKYFSLNNRIEPTDLKEIIHVPSKFKQGYVLEYLDVKDDLLYFIMQEKSDEESLRIMYPNIASITEKIYKISNHIYKNYGHKPILQTNNNLKEIILSAKNCDYVVDRIYDIYKITDNSIVLTIQDTLQIKNCFVKIQSPLDNINGTTYNTLYEENFTDTKQMKISFVDFDHFYLNNTNGLKCEVVIEYSNGNKQICSVNIPIAIENTNKHIYTIEGDLASLENSKISLKNILANIQQNSIIEIKTETKDKYELVIDQLELPKTKCQLILESNELLENFFKIQFYTTK